MNNNNPRTNPQGSTPVPDPTVLTTQQLVREIAASREIIEERLDAMDIATKLNKEATDKIPCMVQKAIESLKAINDEKFTSIQIQFRERDTRTEQTRTSDKIAVDAALQAAKEAVGEQNKSNALAIAKSETAFTKQLDQIITLITTANKALDDKINDLKGRLDRGEGVKTQQVETKGQQNWFMGLFVIGGLSVISIIVAIVGMLR